MSVVTCVSEPAQREVREEEDEPKRTQLEYVKLVGDDAEKVFSMFGVEGCLVEVNPGRVLLPPKYQEIGERILDLPVLPDDVWLVSYPRTGSTWAQEMVWCIGHGLDYTTAKNTQLVVRVPLIELTALMSEDHPAFMEELGDSVSVLQHVPSPRYIRSHLTWDLLPTQLAPVGPKIVYVARNPKDLCVSLYHYCVLLHNLSGTFEDFCELFLRDRAPVGPLWSHVLGFWNRRHDHNILFLKYEDMKKDQAGAIRKTAAFLGKTLTESDIETLTDYLSFGNMQKNTSVNLEPLFALTHGADYMEKSGRRFIRKGQVGDWKNHMTPEMAARFDKWTEDNLRGTGLSFD